MRKKIIISIMLSIVVILVSLGIVSSLSVNDSIMHSLNERLELSAILANYTDYILQRHLTRLYDVSLAGTIDLEDGDWWPEEKALKTAYEYSIFSDGLFIVDPRGDIVASYPAGQIRKRNLINVPPVHSALAEKKCVVSDILIEEETKKKVIYVLVPLRDSSGKVIGSVGGEINPTNYIFNNIIRTIPAGSSTVIELVDSAGVVIASNNPVRIFACSDRNKVLGNLIASKKRMVMECHRCHEEEKAGEVAAASSAPPAGSKRTTDMLAFAPLTEAPWGISVREPAGLVFGPSHDLKKRFLVLGIVAIGSALILALGLSKGIVTPIKSLIGATRRLADGNLKEPVIVESRDEIADLSHSFDIMRQRLDDSLDRIQRHNLELEGRVVERTEELLRSRKRLENLFHEVIRAQEDERKRIARELHDEASQSIAACAMSLEIAAIALKEGKLTPQGIEELRDKITQLLEGINRIIHDLRPPVLDDLGMESAVRWLLDRHLAENGVVCHFRSCPEFSRITSRGRAVLDEKTELTLFRVIQEAIINISKHARASYVSVSITCEDSNININIKDDGIGFDVQEVLQAADRGMNVGYGLLGLRERVALLDGSLHLNSVNGEGSTMTINIPVQPMGMGGV